MLAQISCRENSRSFAHQKAKLATVNSGGQGDWSTQGIQPIYFPLPTLQN
ncbi:MAG: hypothetical protein F6J90_27660 [Moorea sp. SIOASIH]|nr:hypothetical protein [Moorena sp. SIOASIH]NEO39906.1 hypothetical protein [Moorena sp. SIOASIH]